MLLNIYISFFLGFVVFAICPNRDKVKSIQETPEPTNKKQLQVFLGLLNLNRTPNTLSTQMMRWSLLLNGYDFELVYKPGTSIQN